MQTRAMQFPISQSGEPLQKKSETNIFFKFNLIESAHSLLFQRQKCHNKVHAELGERGWGPGFSIPVTDFFNFSEFLAR